MINTIVERAKERAKEADLPLWDDYIYQTDTVGWGRPALLDDTQKERLQQTIVQDRKHRHTPADILLQIELWKEVSVPRLSRTTLQNTMFTLNGIRAPSSL